MVSIGKVKEGNRMYVVMQVAKSAEEYYSGFGEAEGTWLGAAAHDLGLGGKVAVHDFKMALDGKIPGSRNALSPKFNQAGRVLAIDITFSAPKSVSAMFALGSPKVRQQIQDIHDEAVLDAMAYMETNAGWAREGKAGKYKTVGRGLIASGWRHRTSRDGDPQLHSHVVTNNMVQTIGGKWMSLDTGRIWHHGPTCGRIYQHALRRGMTEHFKVAWGPRKNGLAEIVGFPTDLKKLWSKRTKSIDDESARSGRQGTDGRQIAALRTRQPKGNTSSDTMFDDWKKEAAERGYSWKTMAALCGQVEKAESLTNSRENEILDIMRSTMALTQESAHFDRRHVINTVADFSPPTTPRRQIEKLADFYIDHDAIMLSGVRIDVTQSAGKSAAAGLPSLTSPQMQAYEQAAIQSIESRMKTRVAELSSVRLDALLEIYGPTLSDEQAAMVRSVSGSGNGVDVVTGDAGTGKTYALNVLRQVYEHTGDCNVVGTALSAAAAEQLAEGASIKSMTIKSLLMLTRKNPEAVFPGEYDVLVVDEAAMVGTKHLAELILLAGRRNIKLVLVGDDKQLPPIDAGGLFRDAKKLVGDSRLTMNRRQRHAEQRELVDAFKNGEARLALEIADSLGQLVVRDEHDETLAELYRAWAADPCREESMMIAGRRDEVMLLNCRAQGQRFDEGQIGGERLDIGAYNYYVGDRVRCRAVDGPKRQVTNGTLGEVVSIDPHHRCLTIRTDDGKFVRLPASYVADHEKLQLGYAITAHSAQGSTCETAHVLLTDQTYRELGYTASSRAREKTTFYVTAAPVEPAEVGFDPNEQYDRLDHVVRGLNKSKAQTAAIGIGEADQFVRLPDANLVEAMIQSRRAMGIEYSADDGDVLDLISGEGVNFRNVAAKEWAATHPVDADFYRGLNQELERRISARVNQSMEAVPAYLAREIGAVPANPQASEYWKKAAVVIERHRARFGIDIKDRAYGEASAGGAHKVGERVARARVKQIREVIQRAERSSRGRSL